MGEVILREDPERTGNTPTPIPDRVELDKVIDFIHAFMSEGLTITEASQKVGISDRTARNWRASAWWPTAMLAAEAQLRDEYLGAGLSALMKGAREGNTKAAADLVKSIIALNAQSPVHSAPLDRRHGVAAIRPAMDTENKTDEELRLLAEGK